MIKRIISTSQNLKAELCVSILAIILFRFCVAVGSLTTVSIGDMAVFMVIWFPGAFSIVLMVNRVMGNLKNTNLKIFTTLVSVFSTFISLLLSTYIIGYQNWYNPNVQRLLGHNQISTGLVLGFGFLLVGLLVACIFSSLVRKLLLLDNKS